MKRIPDNWSWTGTTEAPPKPCLSPDHNPPTHIVLEPGTHEHTCPLCGKPQIVIVPKGATW